ncbi:hypothetical protein HID58_093096 [Brassica napus]|uniref:BnaA02g29810D protein n=4 Tax=Brassica TaxID=3705 RepID=A0A078I3F5_BRANA|nr:hypothetical protein HID58_091447 [Brassica napus]CAG7895512.1 unnamed protein product [Brassica rapa]KAH0853537.1 hypothetical protein HID58_093096 [Brassica napus]CAF2143842.1 unnamed protein product [Brassica napus]CDY44396.1 BnaA02g29810D [Brassica napus]
MCFSKVSSEPDRVETMALECGLKERENEMSFLDGVELEKPEGVRKRTEVTYSLLVSIFVRCGRSELALDAYDEMIHKNISPRGMHDESSRVEPDVSLYNAVIHGMCLIREFKFAKELYVEMREMRLEPDGKTRAMMLQNLKRL